MLSGRRHCIMGESEGPIKSKNRYDFTQSRIGRRDGFNRIPNLDM